MEVKEETSPEKWRARRRWLLAMVFGFAMLLGVAVDSVIIPMVIVFVSALRAGWLFHRHRIADEPA